MLHFSSPPFGAGQSSSLCLGPPHSGHTLSTVEAMAESIDVFAFLGGRSGFVENDEKRPFEPLIIMESVVGGNVGPVGSVGIRGLTKG